MPSHVAAEISTAAEFIAKLTDLTHHNGRTLKARKSEGSGLLFVNFFNLPPGIGSAGGGAEAENNRAMFTIKGWDVDNLDAPPPTGKVKVDTSVNVFHRTLKLRAKTGTPAAVCKYLADYINRVAKEIPPNYTHTKMARAVARRFIAQHLSR